MSTKHWTRVANNMRQRALRSFRHGRVDEGTFYAQEWFSTWDAIFRRLA